MLPRDLAKASQVLPFRAGYRNPKTISVGPWGGKGGNPKTISVGPWGGKGGNPWYDGVYDGIRKIIVVYGDVIDSIDIEYGRNGAFVWSKHGGRGGNNIEKIEIELDYRNERITSISGHYNDTHVRSLTFVSNAKKYGPYGVEDGKDFSFSIAEGEIVGFHGRSDGYLVCIGVYISPISNLQAPAISKILKPMSVGPWGGKGGDMWDDGVHSGIHPIRVVYGDAIDSINIEYDNNGSPFCLEHRRSTQNKIAEIQLDYPREILTSISGHYDTYLRSLTFKSNLKDYGPYGRQEGTYFSFPISDGKIVGFHGQSGYLSNLHTPVPPKSNTVISVAPWGGEGGDEWDDGACAGVRQIRLVHGQAINSIQIEYERDGSSVWSRHGGTGGNKADMIILDYPQESLISISGRYYNGLMSLCFESTLKKYGPYGVDEGTYFSFPITEGRIVGFHGKSGQYLDSIGVYISNLPYSIPKQSNGLISIGPWGGEGGDQWNDGACAGVRQIILVHGEAIHSIQIEYERDGRSVSPRPSRHGGRGGNKTDRIILDYPRESLISISGHYNNCLRSLCFESNLKKYGPYGVEQGTYFSFPITEGRIVGFYGRSGRYLDSIGVYISNLHYSIPSQSISAGPWGGNGGDGWCDGEYRGIRQIILVHGQFIGSINIEYEKDGKFVWSKHGGVGTKTDKIELDYPGECLTSISGYYDISLTSLTFKSNYEKTYGPYGVESGSYFSFPTKGKIVSFHGRSGCYLDCIGVYLSNLHAPNPPKSIEPISVGPWGGEWGGKGGSMWDDGVWSGIHQIMIAHREFIDSFDIEYDRDGTRVWLSHGGKDPYGKRGDKADKIELDYPREYLTSLSGHYDGCVTSLTFESNLRKCGPYGKQRGTYFSVPVFKGKIVGFHGRSGSNSSLDRLGVYLSISQTQNLETQMNSQSIEPISVGPWGGDWPYQEGRLWDDGMWSGIHQIVIARREFIDSIDIEYDRDGTRVWVAHRSFDPFAKQGRKTDKIELDYPREYLTSLSGHSEENVYGHVTSLSGDSERSLTSLTFESNVRKYGPYGKEGGTYFSFSLSKGKIVGFHGRSGWTLDRLGVYLSTSQTQNLETQMNSQSIEPISVGPWGGEGGHKWDDGVWSGIHQIMIAHREFIDSIDIEYDRDGTRVWLTHGGEDPSAKRGDKADKIELDYPREYLTSLSGYYEGCVTSLTFESNLRKYGPYGKQGGTHFSVSRFKGKIVGFYGGSGSSLDRLGVFFSTSQTQNLETQMNSQVSQSEEIEDGNENNDTVGSI